METNCQHISYSSTGFFSKLVLDYISGSTALRPFFHHTASLQGIKDAIEVRKQTFTPRNLLVTELTKQYAGITLTTLQQQNLQALLSNDTFTICTAHQPNIFTGPLYFIYKILHVIKLADQLKADLPQYNFVPVYYMGSEDADLDELGHVYIRGEKLPWLTNQTGAVGRMLVDKNLHQLIERIEGELGVLPWGNEIITILKNAYSIGQSIQQSTLIFVNELFKQFGLLVLIPDNRELKQVFTPIVTRELLEQFSHLLVEETGQQLSEQYKMQASGRNINLFYLTDGRRDRIIKEDNIYKVEGVGLHFTEQEIILHAQQHPEHFSANVILRGVFQETVLPNIAFVGGGGEIAYWLELKKVFEACEVPYPVLLIRNSFLLVNKAQQHAVKKLGFALTDFFKHSEDLVAEMAKREATVQLDLNKEKEQAEQLYQTIKKVAASIDTSLGEHTEVITKRALQTLTSLEKKMLRAEKRKLIDQRRQIEKYKSLLFPNNNLQERVDNYLPFYATYGAGLMQQLYNASLPLSQEFTILYL